MNAKEATATVDELFGLSYTMLVRYAMRAIHRVEVAEDLVQEAFMLLYRALRRGQTVSNPKAWLFCVIRRLISKEITARRMTGDLDVPLVELDELPAPGPSSTEAELDDIARLFSVLTRREEEVILLRMAALKYREIGEQLGISPKSVGTLLARALSKLQKAARSKSSGASDYSSYVATTHFKTLQ